MDKARTNSTLLLKQFNSLEVDRTELRKTKSAENMFTAPTIVIDQTSLQIPEQQDLHSQSHSPNAIPLSLSPTPSALSPMSTPHLLSPSMPKNEVNNLLKTPKLNFSLPKFSPGQTAKVCDGSGRSLDIQSYKGEEKEGFLSSTF